MGAQDRGLVFSQCLPGNRMRFFGRRIPHWLSSPPTSSLRLAAAAFWQFDRSQSVLTGPWRVSGVVITDRSFSILSTIFVCVCVCV
jgi:hypothetical protein